MNHDLRLIEDYLPIEAISAEASREKSVRKGHISTLHLWWARRPLVACRAAVYGALVPADRWVPDVDVKSPSADAAKAEAIANGKKKGLNRKAAKEFVIKLCRFPKTDPTKPAELKLKRDTEAAIVEAQKHILEAHSEGLTAELAEAKEAGKPPAWVEEFKFVGDKVTYADIVAGRAPRPRVLDMFAGGGAIPFEAIRLGCEAYALDLNPVAHIIQLCTLVYPQKYGKSDPATRGMTGNKTARGDTTWGGLPAEVRYWGNWVLDRVRREVGELYKPIPDPAVWDIPPEITFDHQTSQWSVTKSGKPKRGGKLEAPSVAPPGDSRMFSDGDEDEDVLGAPTKLPSGYLQPVAYLWTRCVRCKNPGCGVMVPLIRQTWLCKKAGRYVAMKPRVQKGADHVSFIVKEVASPEDLGFDPEEFSEGGSATCVSCGTVADSEYVKRQGEEQRITAQMTAVVCKRPDRSGKVYLAADDCPDALPRPQYIRKLLDAFQSSRNLVTPAEPIDANPRSMDTQNYGFATWGSIFSDRQVACLLSFVGAIHDAAKEMAALQIETSRANAIQTYLGATLDKVAEIGNTLCRWEPVAQCTRGVYGRQSLPMVWDYGETVPTASSAGNWGEHLQRVLDGVTLAVGTGLPARVIRGSATELPFETASLDAVVSDPPYYDNVSYSNLSDFFYVWLKKSIGRIYPEHFATDATPKKKEAIAAAYRQGGKEQSRKVYEGLMSESLREAARVLKPTGNLVIVYAHKTTLGWSTLVDAMRTAGFTVVEAWPLDTENKSRLVAQDTAALASSIFLVARKRTTGAGAGNYEDDVQPELGQIVRERVETLWDMGITGADLVIACVGAGLRAFTKYEKVEYANGEEVPAEKFLAEVEGVVLDTMLGKLSGVTGGNVAAVDPASRFYVLWRFVYKTAEIDAGEAIVFTYAQHVELDGPRGLSDGKDTLVEKKKAKYRARDFTERGQNEKLGLPDDAGRPAPLIDALHRVLWLMENNPRKLNVFLDEAQLDRERLRVLAQALAGAALSGKSEEESSKLVTTTPAEQSAIGKLLANWRSLIESRLAAEDKTLFGKQGR